MIFGRSLIVHYCSISSPFSITQRQKYHTGQLRPTITMTTGQLNPCMILMLKLETCRLRSKKSKLSFLNLSHQERHMSSSTVVSSSNDLSIVKIKEIGSVDSEQSYQRLFTPELRFVWRIFRESGHGIRIVGGAVRDLLMNIEPRDVDLVTTATPKEIVKVLDENFVKITSLAGAMHATIQFEVNKPARQFEITSLQYKEVVDGGRRVVTRLTTDWRQDARRGRDFTINSLTMDDKGCIFDYHSGRGIADVQAGRVRYVPDNAENIPLETPTAVIRYFRFLSQCTPPPLPSNKDSESEIDRWKQDELDPQMLDIVKRNVNLISTIPTFKIRYNMDHILSGRNGAAVLRLMLSSDHEYRVGPHLGLGDTDDTAFNWDGFERVWHAVHSYDPQLVERKITTFIWALLDGHVDGCRGFFERTEMDKRSGRYLADFLRENISMTTLNTTNNDNNDVEKGFNAKEEDGCYDRYRRLFVWYRDMREPFRTLHFDKDVLPKFVIQLMAIHGRPEAEIRRFAEESKLLSDAGKNKTAKNPSKTFGTIRRFPMPNNLSDFHSILGVDRKQLTNDHRAACHKLWTESGYQMIKEELIGDLHGQLNLPPRKPAIVNKMAEEFLEKYCGV